MNSRLLASVSIAAAIAFARPVAFVAQEAGKAADILAAARKAIGDAKVDSLKTFSLHSSLQRNVGSMQLTSDIEILLDLPDKYVRDETMTGPMQRGGGVTGFNGDRSLSKMNAMSGGGGAIVFSMGGAAPAGGEKASPEQLEEMNRTSVRASRTEVSRLMLGWFAMAHPAANAEYTYAGEAQSPDGKAYVIDVKNADGLKARLFIDEQTNLPLMVTYQAPQPRMITNGMGSATQLTPMSGDPHVMTRSSAPMSDEERKKQQAGMEEKVREIQREPAVMGDYTIFFDDWRDAGGVKFPFKMRRALASTTTEEWTIDKVKVNPKIDPKRFAPQG